MDENKLKVLKEIGYVIRETCCTCKHSLIEDSGWGECFVTNYEHQKHTESLRRLSIYQTGWCPKYQADPGKIAGLHLFQQLIEKGTK